MLTSHLSTWLLPRRSCMGAHMCVWVHTCVYGCTHVCMGAHMCVWVHTCVYECTHVCMGAHMCVWVHTCVYECTHLCTIYYMCVLACVVCMDVSISLSPTPPLSLSAVPTSMCASLSPQVIFSTISRDNRACLLFECVCLCLCYMDCTADCR